MKILAIDTSTEACSAALFIDGATAERFQMAPRDHAKLIIPMVDDLLAEAEVLIGDMDALAFGRGPGSFTGVRIATSVVQGIALGADLPVVPVSSLGAMAQGRHREHGDEYILTAIDARMNEVYWCQYRLGEEGIMSPMVDEIVCAAEDISKPEGEGWCGVGTGWDAQGEVLIPLLGKQLKLVEPSRFPHAQDIALIAARDFQLGKGLPAEQAQPVYLREQVAWKKADS